MNISGDECLVNPSRFHVTYADDTHLNQWKNSLTRDALTLYLYRNNRWLHSFKKKNVCLKPAAL